MEIYWIPTTVLSYDIYIICQENLLHIIVFRVFTEGQPFSLEDPHDSNDSDTIFSLLVSAENSDNHIKHTYHVKLKQHDSPSQTEKTSLSDQMLQNLQGYVLQTNRRLVLKKRLFCWECVVFERLKDCWFNPFRSTCFTITFSFVFSQRSESIFIAPFSFEALIFSPLSLLTENRGRLTF